MPNTSGDAAVQEAASVLHSQESRMKELQEKFARERAQLSHTALESVKAQLLDIERQDRENDRNCTEEKRKHEQMLYRKIDEKMVKDTPRELWLHDKKVYEKCAPSWRYLCEVGWYDRTNKQQRESVYSQSSEDFMESRRIEGKGYWYENNRTENGPRALYSDIAEAYLAHKKSTKVKNWRVFDH